MRDFEKIYVLAYREGSGYNPFVIEGILLLYTTKAKAIEALAMYNKENGDSMKYIEVEKLQKFYKEIISKGIKYFLVDGEGEVEVVEEYVEIKSPLPQPEERIFVGKPVSNSSMLRPYERELNSENTYDGVKDLSKSEADSIYERSARKAETSSKREAVYIVLAVIWLFFMIGSCASRSDNTTNDYQLPDSYTDFELPDSYTDFELPDSYTDYELPDNITDYQLPDNITDYELPDNIYTDGTDYNIPESLYEDDSVGKLPDNDTDVVNENGSGDIGGYQDIPQQ